MRGRAGVSAAAIDVYWLECCAADLPADDCWLTDNELPTLRGFRMPKRRNDWRLGRWAAKQAVAAYLGMTVDARSLRRIEIRPADSGAPQVLLPLGPVRVSISITHCHGTAACAVTAPGVAIGCDLEAIEPRSEAFVDDYFLESEKALLTRSPAPDRPWLTTLLWSAKESALKALQEGLRLDTRSVEVEFDLGSYEGEEWRLLAVTCNRHQTLSGWWCRDQTFVRTLVGDPALSSPLLVRPGVFEGSHA